MEKIVLDLETKKSFAEVEGRNYELLGVSVVGIYSYQDDQFKVFTEKEIKKLLPYLQRAKLTVGFNIRRFDYVVLQPYLDELDLSKLATLDILEEVHKSLGFRVSLNNLARATLDIGKIGTGLDALKFFRQGQMDKLMQYCQHDVFVTRELYEYGRKYGHLIYHRTFSLETIPISWGEAQTVEQTLAQAFQQRLSVEIEYAPTTNNNPQRTSRQIDIYALDLGRIIAYCHLRQGLRTFNIRRVLSIKLTKNKYEVPATFDIQQYKSGYNTFNIEKNKR